MKMNTRKSRTLRAWALGSVANLLLCACAFGQYQASQTGITINDNSPGTPYPSTIDLTRSNIVGSIEKVTVTLNNLKHGYANDVGVLLVAPNGQNVVLMNNAGFGLPINGVNITFDANGAPLPQFSGISSGTFAPGDFSGRNFFLNAPAGPYGTLAGLATSTPNGKWSLYVQDDQPQASGTIDSWTLNLYTTPLVSLGTNQIYLAENGGAGTVNLALQDSSPPAGGFKISAINYATNLVSVSSSLSGLNGTITLTPKKNAYGTNTLTLVVDDGLATVQTNLTVALAFVDQPPTIAITNAPVSTVPGVLTASINTVVNDVDDAATNLKLSVTSSDTNIVSPAGVFFSPTDTGNLRKFTVIPNGSATGSATLNFIVTDSASLSATNSLVVNVGSASHPLFASTNVLDLSDSGVTSSSIAVTNIPGALARATVAVAGLKGVNPGNLGLALEAPGGTLTLLSPNGGAGPNSFAQLVFDDAGGAMPSADTYTSTRVAPSQPLSTLAGSNPNGTWKLWVTNGGAAAQITSGWVLNLYVAPIITSSVTNISMPEQASTNITFNVSDLNGAITNASSVTITSGDPTLLKVSGLTFNTSTGNGSAQIQALFSPTGSQYGTNTVTITATDNNNFVSSYTYTVAVTFVNHAPVISFIPKQVTYAGVSVGPVAFSVTDVDLPAQTLNIAASSDNQKLLPDGNIVLGNSGNNYTFTIFPVGAAAGTANVTLSASDGNGGTTSATFALVVEGPGNPLFANLNQIDVPANALAIPSTNIVENLVGTISTVQVSLFGINHTAAQNLNVLLVSPTGKKVLLMGHAGGNSALNGTTLVFDDTAPSLPQTQITSGSYKPTQYTPNATFPDPVPAAPYDTTLAAFNGLSGADANGPWVLYVYDDGLGKGTISSGWQLSIRTTPSVQPIADQTLPENAPTSQIAVSVGDDQPGLNITVGVTSDNPNVINVAFEPGTGGTRTLDITPVPYQFASNINVTVTAQIGSDASTLSTTTFHATVYQVDLAPVISPIADVTTTRATPVTTSFTVWDPQDKALQWTAVSSDPKLLPDANIALSSGTVVGTTNGHNIYQYNISVLPGDALSGQASISLTVNDSVKQSAVAKFNVIVNQGGPLFASSDGPITIPIGYPLSSNATPFPSIISVSNLDGFVTGVKVTLLGFQHTYPSDVDVLLVSPDNTKSVVLMAHAGGANPVSNLRLMFDQSSTNLLPVNDALASQTYAPGDYAAALSFAPSAPASGYTTNLNSFFGTSPNGNWKLYVMADDVGAGGSIDGWMLSLETSPAITSIAPQTTPENTAKVIGFTVLSDSVDPASLTVTASASGDAPANLNWHLIKDLIVTNAGGANWVLTAVPADNLPSSVTNVDGSVNINLQVSDGTVTYTTAFPLTVTYANQAPAVTTQTNAIYFTEGSSASIDFQVADVDSTLYTTNVVVVSTDPTLVPNSSDGISITASTNRFLSGQTGTVTVGVTPATHYTFGTNTLTFAITDGNSWVTNTVTLNIAHKYQAPLITGLPDSATIAAATTSAPIPFTVSSPEGVSPKSLNVTASSSDQTLIPDGNIALSGAGSADRAVTLTPLGTASGTAQITLTIDDQKATNQFSFSVTVASPPPGLFGYGQLVTITNTANQPYPISFNVANLVGSVSHVSVELRGLTHNDPANLDVLLVGPDGTAVMLMSGAGGADAVSGLDLVFDDSGAAMPASGTLVSGTNHPAYYTLGKRLLPMPAPQSGYVGDLAAFTGSATPNGTWQLFVSDLTSGDIGQITGGCYLSVITTPAIAVSTPAPYVIPENGSLTVHFSLSDSQTAVTNLQVTATSDNKGLLPATAPNLVITADAPGQNNNYTATLQPLAYQYGSADITLKATRADGAAASAVLPITVQGTNLPPVVYRLLPQTTPATQTLSVPILVSDTDTPLSDLSIQAVSLNEAIIGTSNLVFTGSTSNALTGLKSVVGQIGEGVLNITPNPFSVGTATIQLTVTDPMKGVGTNYVITNLVVSVTSVIYGPTISSVPAQSLTAGTTSAPLGFTVGSPNPGTPSLSVAATSSEETLVKSANIVVTPVSGGSGPRTVQLKAEAGVKGTATIRLTVTDTVNNRSAYTEFLVTVIPTPEHDYANTKQIVINDYAPATPYPSTIDVTDLDGTIKKVTVTVNGFTHSYPSDVGLLLVSPGGQKIVLMNKAGGGIAETNLNLTFDSSSTLVVPQGTALSTATYHPADWKTGSYDFPDGAPTHPYSTNLDSLVGSPRGTWSLFVVDDTPQDSGIITGGWALSITTQPVVEDLTDITVNENQSVSVPFSMADDSPAGPSFRFGFAAGDTTLLPLTGLSVAPADNTGTNFSLTVTPALNRFGTNTLTVFATNADNFVASSTVNVLVPFVLQAPSITLATNEFWIDAGTLADIPVDYSDVQFAKNNLAVSFGSSNTQLVPSDGIQLVSDSQGNSHIRIQTFGALSGSSLITMTVAQPNGGKITSASFTLNVVPVQNLFGSGAKITINDFAPATPYPSSIMVSNVGGNILRTTVRILGLQHSYPHDITMVLVGPGGQKVILMSQVSNGNPATNVDLTFDSTATASLPGSTDPLVSGTYAATSYNGNVILDTNNVSGPYVTNLNAFTGSPNGPWSLYVQDDAKQDDGAILNGWLLSFVTDAPTITSVPAQVTSENTPLTVNFTVGSAVVADLSKLTVTASVASENPASLVSKGLSVSGPLADAPASRTLTINPGLNLPSSAISSNGTATITLNVTDGTNTSSTSFPLTVLYVNQAPVLSGLSDTNTPANAPLGISFQANDVDTPSPQLTLTVSNSAPELGQVTVSQTANQGLLTFVPEGVQGTAIITVTLSDGQLSDTQTFNLTVTPAVPPVLGVIGPQATTANTPAVVPLSVTDSVTALTNLEFTGTSSNPKLVSGIDFAVTSSGVTATVGLMPNQVGTADITILVSDGVTNASQTFTLTVSAPAAPVLAAIADQTVLANRPLSVPLTVTDSAMPISALTITAAHTNMMLVKGLTVANDGTNVALAVGVITNQIGVDYLTVSVNDGFTTVSQGFQLTVNPPTAPTLAPIADQTGTSGKPLQVVLSVTSPDTAIASLAFSGACTNTALISSMSFACNGTAEVATLNLLTNRAGDDRITLSVADAFSTNSVSFNLHVVAPIGPSLTLSTDGEQVTVKFTGAAKASYGLQTATSPNGPWTDVITITADDSGAAEHADTIKSDGSPHFYRAVVK